MFQYCICRREIPKPDIQLQDGCVTYSVPAGEPLTSDIPAGRKGDSYAREESKSVSWQQILKKICILPLVDFNF
jgi:hypothetical protein